MCPLPGYKQVVGSPLLSVWDVTGKPCLSWSRYKRRKSTTRPDPYVRMNVIRIPAVPPLYGFFHRKVRTPVTERRSSSRSRDRIILGNRNPRTVVVIESSISFLGYKVNVGLISKSLHVYTFRNTVTPNDQYWTLYNGLSPWLFCWRPDTLSFLIRVFIRHRFSHRLRLFPSPDC